jgi:hypothetical protein
MNHIYIYASMRAISQVLMYVCLSHFLLFISFVLADVDCTKVPRGYGSLQAVPAGHKEFPDLRFDGLPPSPFMVHDVNAYRYSNIVPARLEGG